MTKENIDLSGIVKFQTQFDPIFGDKAAQNVSCAKASKKMITDAGFKTVDASGRIDVVVYDTNKKLVKGKDFEKGVEQLHKNLDEKKPTLVAVNRSNKDYGNANKCSNHYVVIVGRFYNVTTGKYEYRFFDPGTSYINKGTAKDQFFTLNSTTGFWEGVSNYNKTKYIITEIRPTHD